MVLSIGVELEGIAVCYQASSEPFPITTEKQLQILSDALNKAGLPSRVYIPSTTRGTGPDYSSWNVMIDATIAEGTSTSSVDEREAFRSRFGFELVTPVFYDSVQPEWPNFITRGVAAITSVVDWKVNRSTGLHVHVGAGAGSAQFSLDKIKKIAIFTCRFENAMDEFHPLSRRMDNDNIMSNRNNAMLVNMDYPQIYELIRKGSTIEEVCQTVNFLEGASTHDGYSDSRFFKVNFTSLLKHHTIEFRQHEGTTEAAIMVRWVQVVLKIVDFARASSYAILTARGESPDDMLQYIRPRS